MQSNAKDVETVIRSAKVLIVDDEYYMRKVIRTLLLSVGVTDVHDAPDGASGLLAIGALDPDVVMLDWQMDGMNGPEFVRRVRAPDRFSFPNVPIIMLTGHGEHSRVVEAIRLGVHEFLVKPVSAKALYERWPPSCCIRARWCGAASITAPRRARCRAAWPISRARSGRASPQCKPSASRRSTGQPRMW